MRVSPKVDEFSKFDFGLRLRGVQAAEEAKRDLAEAEAQGRKEASAASRAARASRDQGTRTRLSPSGAFGLV